MATKVGEKGTKQTQAWLENLKRGFSAIDNLDFDEARNQFNQGIQQAIEVRNNKGRIYCMVGLTKVNLYDEDFVEAEKCALKAVHYAISDPAFDEEAYALCLAVQGQVYARTNRDKDAAYVLERAYEISRTKKRFECPMNVDFFTTLINCYQMEDEYGKAEKVCEQIYSMSKSLFGSTDKSTLKVLHLWAICAEELGQTSRANKLYSDLESYWKQVA